VPSAASEEHRPKRSSRLLYYCIYCTISCSTCHGLKTPRRRAVSLIRGVARAPSRVEATSLRIAPSSSSRPYGLRLKLLKFGDDPTNRLLLYPPRMSAVKGRHSCSIYTAEYICNLKAI
jgi:hypothetical protein